LLRLGAQGALRKVGAARSGINLGFGFGVDVGALGLHGSCGGLGIGALGGRSAVSALAALAAVAAITVAAAARAAFTPFLVIPAWRIFGGGRGAVLVGRCFGLAHRRGIVALAFFAFALFAATAAATAATSAARTSTALTAFAVAGFLAFGLGAVLRQCGVGRFQFVLLGRQGV
jgi:hypothetical protein